MRGYLALLLAAPMLVAQPLEVRTLDLANGMKVLVQEDHNIPNVALYFFYRIGSRNERPGITGISHFFEHMMFNGAKKYGPKQFDNEMEKAGGHNNAYTSTDVTVYQDWIPNTALELMMDLESDRIRDLAFDPKIIESERGVVYSERRTSVDNNNAGILNEQLMAAAFTAHPYHWPVVGWASDIESWTLDDLKTHFRMGYAPNNCTLVVVGDVSFAQVAALAKKYLEPIERRDPPPAVRTKEPAQLGERRLVVKKPAQLPLQMIGYHIPDARHKDGPAIDLTAALLTRGQSSRLYRRLVLQDQTALSVMAFPRDTLDPGLLIFNIQPRSGVDPARTEAALFEEIAKLQAAEIPAAELRKARNQILVSHYQQMKTIAGRANLLGLHEVFLGDYRRLFAVEKEIEAVTPADIQRVAATYLAERNRTVATLIPDNPSSREAK